MSVADIVRNLCSGIKISMMLGYIRPVYFPLLALVGVIQGGSLYHKLVITIEEHSKVGGLGSAVAEVKAALTTTTPQIIMGLPASYGKAGEYPNVLKENGLDEETIFLNIMKKLNQFKLLKNITMAQETQSPMA